MIRTAQIVCSLGVFVGLVTAKAVYVGARNLVGGEAANGEVRTSDALAEGSPGAVGCAR